MSRIRGGAVRKIVVACEAGMGSSALLVSQLRQRLRGLPIHIDHASVNRIPADADVVLCHRGLAERARQVAPDKVVLPFDIFIGDPTLEHLVRAIQEDTWIEG
ncbi:MAG: PTS lactose transporter subunit IIB [Thermoflexus sp.]